MSKRKKLIRITLASAGLILAAAGLSTGLFAHYVSDNKKKAEMTSSQFHLSSDYLEEDEKTYSITNWGDGFDIHLYNYEKENLALVSADPITYQIEVSGTGWTCDTESSDGTLKEVENKKNVWEAELGTSNADDSKNSGKVSQKIHLKPTLEDIDQNSTVTVTVTSKKPYEKTIRASFSVASKKLPEYTLTDRKDGSCLLTIRSNDCADMVTVTWDPQNYAPDSTNELITVSGEESDMKTQELSLEANTTYEILFFYLGTGTPRLSATTGRATILQ